MQIFEQKLNGKIICTKLKGDYLYMLNKFFLLFVIQIEPNYKHPKLWSKSYVQNMYQPRSIDLDDEKLYVIDEEKGIFQFKLTQIHQVYQKNEISLEGESIYNKSKSGKIIIKPFNNENYFMIIGKQNQRNYIAEVQNENTISTSDDEPTIKKAYINHSYIVFITEDNIHVIYRGIDENQVKSTEKQYTFEQIGVQDIYLDPNDDNLFYAITNTRILALSIMRTQSSIVCFYNERSEASEEKLNIYQIQFITNKCNDSTVKYCQNEIEMNVYIGKSGITQDAEAFLIGLFSGIGLLFIVTIVFLIKRKKVVKTENYNHFDNENEQDPDLAEQDSRKV